MRDYAQVMMNQAPDDRDAKACMNQALAALSRRDFGRVELGDRLKRKGFDAETISVALDRCQDYGLLDDAKVMDHRIHALMRRGYGPAFISMDLKRKGFSEKIITEHLPQDGNLWAERAQWIRCKHFGNPLPHDSSERVRQMRYLYQRGFDRETAHRICSHSID